ncbi:hypothetical protein R3P38DRAFT_2763260 [Favolaschia claudopus]|uniref:Uncharacterized protein n=1 Tax=Favolaschia claudopus TaxID=2862362 RepID=A0AAW0DE76_9AGAR
MSAIPKAELAELFVLLADARTTNELARGVDLEVTAKLVQLSLYNAFSEVQCVDPDSLSHTWGYLHLDSLSEVYSIDVYSCGPHNCLTVGFYTVEPIKHVPRLFTFYALPPFIMVGCGLTILAFGHRRAPILAVFMRDGLFWFLALVVLGVTELVIWHTGRPSLAEIPVVIHYIQARNCSFRATAIISTRVILNVKQMTTQTSHTTLHGDTTMGTQLEVYALVEIVVHSVYVITESGGSIICDHALCLALCIAV